MRFHFENIGPIQSADLELGDLTLVAGKNNTGKTYIVYTMYGFLRTWPGRLFSDSLSKSPYYHTIRRGLPDLLDGPIGKSVSLDRAAIEQLRGRFLKEYAESFSQEGIAQVFSAGRAKFEGASVMVEAHALPQDMERSVRVGPYELRVTCGKRDVRVAVAAVAEKRLTDRRRSVLRRPVLREVLTTAAFPDRIEPFILSAERFGISLFYKELDFTKSRLVELLQQLGDDKALDHESPYLVVDRMASRYALPVKDNIDYTRSIPSLRRSTGDQRDGKLQDEIKDLIGGYYRAADHEIRFQSKARKKAFNIPLHLASSSARGLSDMYFYLRHTAARDQLLVIDEPESHLDTANQITLARTLARIVHSGTKVLVTTHSDYLIKEINNLVMLDQLEAGIRRRLGYRADDGLARERVRAYVAENGSLTNCVVDEHGVDMPVFDDTIDRINRVASELTARVAAQGKRQDDA